MAIQRVADRRYRVVIYETEERLMLTEVFARDESRVFEALEEAVKFIGETTSVSISDLRPGKGQRWSSVRE